MKQLIKTIGDRDNPFHRQSLAGNAMLFNDNMWVRLTNGTHNVPLQIEGLACTLVVSYYAFPVNLLFSWIVLSQSLSSFSSPPRMADGFGFAVYSLGCVTINNNLSRSQTFNSSFDTFNNRRRHLIISKPAGLVTASNPNYNYNSGRFLNFGNVATDGSPNLTNFGVRNFIDIGCASGLTARCNQFNGYIRSIELLLRTITNEEARAAFNYGTIFHAWQAGKISIPNPIDLISIDFNRLNGQPPICRTGTRQLTVQVYNNTTPNNSVATYTDWYSL